jgi:phytoene dehydrogenase-like protein
MAKVAIIGAGMAGLACAHALEAGGVDWTLLEASDGVGGRVRTDTVEGFRLDRGFQVYLTAYRAAGELLEYPQLRLRPFRSGARVFDGRGFASVMNPLRHPVAAVSGLAGRPALAVDLARMAPVAVEAVRRPVTEPPASLGRTEDLLRRLDLSDAAVDGFFRSFFGGVFLDRSLSTDESQFRFTLSAFARGDAAVPALGMGEIPRQVAAALPAGRIRLRTPVAAVRRAGAAQEVRLAGGASERCDAVVVATDMSAAHALDPRIPARRWCPTETFHWACDLARLPSPLREPILFLDGTGEGPVNHAACMSSVAPEYAPQGQALVSLSMVGIDWETTGMNALVARTVTQMERWFGRGAMAGWRLLRTDRVLRALPRQHPADLAMRPSHEIDDGLFAGGDHLTDGSIDGAVRSGRLAAEAVLRALRA